MGKSHELTSHSTKEAAKPKPPTPTPQENPLFLTEEELLAAAGISTPAEDRLSNSLQNMPSEQLARKNLASAQKLTGNAFAARAVQRLNTDPTTLIQRHPPGASLLGGTATAPAGGGEGGPSPAPAGTDVEGGGAAGPTAITGGGPGGTPGETPAGPAAAPAGPGAAPAGPEAAPAGPAAAPGTTPAGGAAAAPTALGLPTLQTAYAQNALQTSYGSVAGRPMITGTINVVPDRTALYREYDRVSREGGVINRRTGILWDYGDLAADDAVGGFRTNAFAYNGSIWIDATQTDPTATVHEMLHVNTAPGFLTMVGRTINEGITQRLAVRAVQATGQSVTGSESTYIEEQRVVEALAGVIGDDNLVNAYFNDPNILVNTYEAVMGAGTFPALKATLNADTQAGYDAAVRLLQPVSFETKLALIEVLLWPIFSPPDLPRIGRIISTMGDFEKLMLQIELSDEMEDMDFFTRAMLQSMLGMPGTPESGEPAGETPVPTPEGGEAYA